MKLYEATVEVEADSPEEALVILQAIPLLSNVHGIDEIEGDDEVSEVEEDDD